MMSRREGMALALGALVAGRAARADACTYATPDLSIEYPEQIAAIAALAPDRPAVGSIIADDDVRAEIGRFVATVRERRDLIGAKVIRPESRRVFADYLTEVFLVNFRLDDAKGIYVACGDNALNNHALIGFHAGRMADFHRMHLLDATDKARLRG